MKLTYRMPKKTKRAKIIAEHRHKQITVQGGSQFQFHAQLHSPTSILFLPNDLKVIQKDLLQTVLLALVAIISEVVLSRILG